eukprot:6337123-Amphidinium_carterae.1
MPNEFCTDKFTVTTNSSRTQRFKTPSARSAKTKASNVFEQLGQVSTLLGLFDGCPDATTAAVFLLLLPHSVPSHVTKHGGGALSKDHKKNDNNN